MTSARSRAGAVRSPRFPGVAAGRWHSLALVALALVASVETACAESETAPWWSLGVQSGPSMFDRSLANYQWDTGPNFAYGARGLLGVGRFAAGVGVWSAATTQGTGALPATVAPRVRATSWELIGQARLATWHGTSVMGLANAGGVGIGYHPDFASIVVPGGGAPVQVHYAPIHEWSFGGGMGLERTVVRGWRLSAELDRRAFALEAAHWNGSGVVVGRQWFGDWSARLGLSWVHRLG